MLERKTFQTPAQAANYYGPSIPDISLLSEFANKDIWGHIIDNCKSSQGLRYKMFAVIIKSDKIISQGFSQLLDDETPFVPDNLKTFNNKIASIHAEMHCLLNASNIDLTDSNCLVFGLNKNNNGSPWSACPCISCAKGLNERGVKNVIYPQRLKNGNWKIKVDNVKKLANKTVIMNKNKALYAREMKIASH